MIKCVDLKYSYNTNNVVAGVTLDISAGSITGLIGPSGSGKSTLLKLLSGIIKPKEGEILFHEEDPKIGLMFQEGALFDSLSVLDNVAFPLVNGMVPVSRLPNKVREPVVERCMHVLNRVGLSKAVHKMPGQISGGMRRRASLARAIVGRPSLLLLDDPTAGLDPIASSIIIDFILEIYREYHPTTIIASHDLRRLLPAVDSILFMQDGTIAWSGETKTLPSLDNKLITDFVSCRYDILGIRSNKSQVEVL